MTAPTAPAAEKAAHKPETLPAVETPENNRVDELASLSGLLPIAGSDLTFLDPTQVITLQRTAGNVAVNSLIQRAPGDAPPKSPNLPKYKGRPRGRKVEEEPLQIPSNLPMAVDRMPALMKNIGRVVERQAERMEAKGFESGVAGGTISAGLIFARDAVYFFNANGDLHAVESNFAKELDPEKPDELPPAKFRLPNEDQVLVSEPGRNRSWRVFARLGAPSDGEEDQEIAGLNLRLTDSKPSLPSSMRSGDLVVSVYAPWLLASEDGGPQPGFKAKENAKNPSKDPPKWAVKQYDRLLQSLKDEAARKGVAGAGDGSGTGVKGEGPGGGGRDAGIGTGVSGTGTGAATVTQGKGRGGDPRPKDRAKPDKVAFYVGKAGPALNVWKNGQHEAIPLNPGEPTEETRRRVEEVAARQRSTGERLADGATRTGFTGGAGNAMPTDLELAEATEFNANAAAYPSKMAMLGGSSAEVSPAGWGTTITGAMHNFDMILDWDARHFGTANQAFARLGWVDYYWQVIDISKIPELQDAQALQQSDDEFQKRKRLAAVTGAKDSANVKEATVLATMAAKVRNTTIREGEGMKEDESDWGAANTAFTWPAKAAKSAAMGVAAVWNIGKALLGAWFQKATEPENRREIEFGNSGEFLVRCLANPRPDERKPYDEQTRRATSVAVFPVRVVDVNLRARQVTREDQVELDQTKKLLASLEADLAKDATNERLQKAVEVARRQVGQQQEAYAYSTVEKVGAELADYDKQIAVLEKLKAPKAYLDQMTGDDYAVGLRLRTEIQKRFNRPSNGFVAWYDYEFHLHDVKEARKKKAEQKELAEKKAGKVEPGTALRPRVAFVSEENGALIRMDMLLGREKGTTDQKPSWILADVTSPETSRSYEGSSDKAGITGDEEAVSKAFEAFAEKAEYGRGTIAIDIRGRADLMATGRTILMKPGAWGRWKARLQALVEIAGLVAPMAKGGALLGEVAAIGGAIDAGSKIYDRAANDRLKANFETLTDVLTVLQPMAHGMTSLAESGLLRQTKSGYSLRMLAKGVDIGNDLLMPATFMHDLDKILKDKKMDPADKDAAIGMLLARAFRDKAVQHVRPGAVHGAPSQPHATGRPVGSEGGVPVHAPVELPGLPPPRTEGAGAGATKAEGGGATVREPVTRQADITHKFDTSDTPAPEAPRPKPEPTGADSGAATVPKPAANEPVGQAPPTSAHADRPPRGKDDGQPNEHMSAEQLGIEPGGPLDTPRGRKNRAEQLRREAAWKVDAEVIEQTTRPDAMARARAADFVPIYPKWTDLKAAGRQAKIEGIINAHLGRQGIPPVKVEWGAKPAGHAQFDPSTWTMTLSGDVIRSDHITQDAFAGLVDNAVHETQHTVTTFRGVRMALGDASFNPQAHIPGKIVGEAIAANRRKRPDQEFDETTRGEALEIYQAQVEPRKAGEAPPPGVPDRAAVYARKEAANKALADAKALYDFNVGELARNPNDPELKRNVEESRAAYLQRHAEQVKAHNEYVALPEEIPSWRAGSAVKNAILEQLGHQSRRDDARLRSRQAAAEQRKARAKGDTKGAADAMKRSQDADGEARQAQADLDALRPGTDPQLVGGNVVKRGTPLTDKEASQAPKAPTEGYVQPGELNRRVGRPEPSGGATTRRPATEADAGGPKPAESSPGPKSQPAVTAVGAETGQEATRTAPGTRWAGRVVGSDLPPSDTRQPSIGTGVVYEKRPATQYRSLGEPKEGTSRSEILVDITTGEKYLFKPREGEQSVPTAQMRGIPVREYAPRAKAGEIATRELGLDTPDVQLVEIGGRQGSLTKWIDPTNAAKPEVMSLADFLRPTKETSDFEADSRLKDLQLQPGFKEAWDSIQALDFLINNVDRYQNFGNYMVEFTPTGDFKRLMPIDSELAFTATQGRAVIEKKTSFLEGLTYTQATADKLRELDTNRQAFADKIRPLVGDTAVAGVLARLSDLVADANIKTPAKAPAGARGRP